MRYRVILVSTMLVGTVLATVALAGCGEDQQATTTGNSSTTSADDTSSAPSSSPSATNTPTPSETTPSKTTPSKTTKPSPKPTQPPTATTTKPPPVPPKPTRPTETAAPVVDRCHTSDLLAVTRPLGVATGNSYAVIVVTNQSGEPCRMYGYGGMQLLDGNREPLPTDVQRQPTVPPMLITLPAGAHAYSRIHWGTVPDGTTGCTSAASMMKVTPPDEHDTLSVRWPGGSICQQGKIFQDAYRAGTGTQS